MQNVTQEDLKQAKPSELLDIALNDLLEAELSDQYRINMAYWHDTLPRGGPCEVCLAGAVMAMSLDADPKKDYDTSDFKGLSHVFLAINAFRTGDWWGGMRSLNIPDEVINESGVEADPWMKKHRYKVVDYAEDPNLFKRQMYRAARRFEAYGL